MCEKIFPVGRKFLLTKRKIIDSQFKENWIQKDSLGRKDGSGGWIRTTILGAKVPCPAVRRPRIKTRNIKYRIIKPLKSPIER